MDPIRGRGAWLSCYPFLSRCLRGSGTEWPDPIRVDVTVFQDYIACDSRTQPELVLPVYDAAGHLLGVFDIDSHLRHTFTIRDAEALQDILASTFLQVGKKTL